MPDDCPGPGTVTKRIEVIATSEVMPKKPRAGLSGVLTMKLSPFESVTMKGSPEGFVLMRSVPMAVTPAGSATSTKANPESTAPELNWKRGAKNPESTTETAPEALPLKVAPAIDSGEEKFATLLVGAMPSKSMVVRAVVAATKAARVLKTMVSARAGVEMKVTAARAASVMSNLRKAGMSVNLLVLVMRGHSRGLLRPPLVPDVREREAG